jgi:hypothetical protein
MLKLSSSEQNFKGAQLEDKIISKSPEIKEGAKKSSTNFQI